MLNSQPTAEVKINLSSSDTSEGTVSPESLTFTPVNWDKAQKVTITGVDDNLDDGDIRYTIVTAKASSADTNYNNFDADDVSVTNKDDDTAGVTVDPTKDLTTTEAGGIAEFTVVLNSQPTADVTIGLSSNDTTEGTVLPISLTFTPANWDTAQKVTVIGVDDKLDDGDIAYTIITAAAISADENYNNLDASDVSVTNTDDDSPPTISDIASQETEQDTSTGAIPFVVGDNESAPEDLKLSGHSSNQTLVPDANIAFGGSGANRTVTVTPAAGQSGSATITVTVSDGYLTASDTFELTVYQVKVDGLIKLSSEQDCRYALENVYQTTPADAQVRQQVMQKGAAAEFIAKIVNQGNSTRSFVVKATESAGTGWRVAYKPSNTTDVTTQILGTGWTTSSLAPGGSQTLTIQMTPGTGVNDGAVKSTTLRVYRSTEDATVRDSLQAVTTASSAPRPALTGVNPNTGNNATTATISTPYGTGISPEATVKLTRCGEEDITSTRIEANKALNIILYTCNITGRAVGPWDVVVTNPDGQTATLPGGFIITNDQTPAPTVTRITPDTGENTGPVNVTITGTNSQVGATAKLTKSGQGDIPGTNLNVTSNQITGTFDLTGQTPGVWDVVVTNPDEQVGRLANGFTITPPVVHDMALTQFSIAPNPVQRGAKVTFKVTVKNAGTVTETNVRFRITSGEQTLMGPVNIGTLTAGQQKSGNVRLTIPRTVRPGEYLLTGEVSTVPGETNITNNSQTVKLVVRG